MDFQDRVVLVTGASRGIGQAIALEMARLGATVIGTATTEEGAAKISLYIEQSGLNGCGMVLDVTRQDNIDQVLAAIKEQYKAPEILINNAAITHDNLMLRMKEDEWDDVLATNLTAVYHVCKSVLQDMVKARWGRIINISSVVGSIGNPGQANYAAAKAGLVGFSKSLAQEVVTRGITVNVVAPGLVDTGMARELSDDQREALLSRVPMGRLGKPEEIAYAVAFLASNRAAYVTGHTLHINGGLYMP